MIFMKSALQKKNLLKTSFENHQPDTFLKIILQNTIRKQPPNRTVHFGDFWVLEGGKQQSNRVLVFDILGIFLFLEGGYG